MSNEEIGLRKVYTNEHNHQGRDIPAITELFDLYRQFHEQEPDRHLHLRSASHVGMHTI